MPEPITTWWALMLLGLGAGLISGMLGVGSGLVLIPVMTLLLAFPQKSAQGTSLAVMVPMALVGAYFYWRNPQIEVRLNVAGLIVIGALVGSAIGATLAGHLPASALRRLFAVFLIAVAVRMLVAKPLEGQAVRPSADRQTVDVQSKEGNHDRTEDAANR